MDFHNSDLFENVKDPPMWLCSGVGLMCCSKRQLLTSKYNEYNEIH